MVRGAHSLCILWSHWLTPICSLHHPNPSDLAPHHLRHGAQARNRVYHSGLPPHNRTCVFRWCWRWTRHSSHHTYPQLCLLVTIASTYFITVFKQSEATSDPTTHPSQLILAYLSFLLSVVGVLSGALSTGPVPQARCHDRPPCVESPGRPASANNAFLILLGVIFPLAPPRRSIQRMWNFREYYSPVRARKCLIYVLSLVHSIDMCLLQPDVLYSPSLAVRLHIWTVFCSGCGWLCYRYGPGGIAAPADFPPYHPVDRRALTTIYLFTTLNVFT